jgi:hypothetical protein
MNLRKRERRRASGKKGTISSHTDPSYAPSNRHMNLSGKGHPSERKENEPPNLGREPVNERSIESRRYTKHNNKRLESVEGVNIK